MIDEKKETFHKKFSLESGLSQVGSGIFDGSSIIPKEKRIKAVIQNFLRENLKDTQGTLIKVLENQIISNEPLLAKYEETPLKAIYQKVTEVLNNDLALYELVREVDQLYGRDFQERPHFQKAGHAPHPDDEYTHQSVKDTLINFITIFD